MIVYGSILSPFVRKVLAYGAVASPLANLAHLDVAVDPARWPRVAAYLDGILTRPSFAALVAAERPLFARLA